jgi:hypothetical protein
MAGATEYLRTQAVSRLILDNIYSIGSSWVTMGPHIGQLALHYGANDMGSVMMEENVVSAAGTTYCLDEPVLNHLIRTAGFTPAQRDNTYDILKLNTGPESPDLRVDDWSEAPREEAPPAGAVEPLPTRRVHLERRVRAAELTAQNAPPHLTGIGGHEPELRIGADVLRAGPCVVARGAGPEAVVQHDADPARHDFRRGEPDQLVDGAPVRIELFPRWARAVQAHHPIVVREAHSAFAPRDLAGERRLARAGRARRSGGQRASLGRPEARGPSPLGQLSEVVALVVGHHVEGHNAEGREERSPLGVGKLRVEHVVAGIAEG